MSSEDKEPLSGHCLVHLRCELLLCLRPIVEGRDVDVEEISVWLRVSGILCEPGETYQVGLRRRGNRRKVDETVRPRNGGYLVLVYESIVLPSSKCAWTPAFCRTGDSWSRLGRTSLFGMEK